MSTTEPARNRLMAHVTFFDDKYKQLYAELELAPTEPIKDYSGLIPILQW